MKKYTLEEVEFLLEKQRQHTAFALTLNCSELGIESKIHKVNYIVYNYPIINLDENLKHKAQ